LAAWTARPLMSFKSEEISASAPSVVAMTLTARSTTLNVEMILSETAATTLATSSFSITGGGAFFQLGASVNSSNQVGFGIRSVSATSLGDKVQGFLSSITTGGANALVVGRARETEAIVEKSIEQIAILRGRLGAFERNTLQTSVRSQQIALENLTASESDIRDTDFARETAELARAQILVNAGTSTLALANSIPQNVLSLLQ
jgi:flagellin